MQAGTSASQACHPKVCESGCTCKLCNTHPADVSAVGLPTHARAPPQAAATTPPSATACRRAQTPQAWRTIAMLTQCRSLRGILRGWSARRASGRFGSGEGGRGCATNARPRRPEGWPTGAAYRIHTRSCPVLGPAHAYARPQKSQHSPPPPPTWLQARQRVAALPPQPASRLEAQR